MIAFSITMPMTRVPYMLRVNTRTRIRSTGNTAAVRSKGSHAIWPTTMFKYIFDVCIYIYYTHMNTYTHVVYLCAYLLHACVNTV